MSHYYSQNGRRPRIDISHSACHRPPATPERTEFGMLLIVSREKADEMNVERGICKIINSIMKQVVLNQLAFSSRIILIRTSQDKEA